MPNRKITDLVQIGAISDNDLMLIREFAAVYDRKMTVAQLADKLTAIRTTRLTINDYIVGGTSFAINSSGVNYTKSGDTGDLGSSSSIFNNTEHIQIFLNGVSLIKGSDVVWLSSVSFSLLDAVDDEDDIIVLS